MCATPVKASVKPKSASASAPVSMAAGANANIEPGGRRSFMALAGAAIGSGVLLPEVASAQGSASSTAKPTRQSPDFWPGGARLVVSISMQFEAGG